MVPQSGRRSPKEKGERGHLIALRPQAGYLQFGGLLDLNPLGFKKKKKTRQKEKHLRVTLQNQEIVLKNPDIRCLIKKKKSDKPPLARAELGGAVPSARLSPLPWVVS